MSQQQTALVIVMSHITTDPRVRRQIDWLIEAGWSVDSIGLGEGPDNVRDHFRLAPDPQWIGTKFGTAFIYGLLPHRLKFKVLTQDRIPSEVQRRVRQNHYKLIIFNDRHFVPWIADPKSFPPGSAAHVHLDLHEYFVAELERNTLWRRVTAGYYAWARRLFAHPAFATRSTVNSGIARLYESELSTQPFAIIRNSPPYADLTPGEVDPDNIKLVHHGIASWERGLREIVDAIRLVDQRFSVTFMLLGSDEVISELKAHASDLGDRVRIIPPAPMRELSSVVNRFDLEVMFYRPTTRNLELALPNKLFEAVQGRLGLVIGQSPMMAELVEAHANGVIVTGWSAQDLAAALNDLTAQQVAGFKAASDQAARELNSDTERAIFLETVSSQGAEGALQ